MVVRYTKKMLDLLGARAALLEELLPADDDWYLNLLWMERRKCLVLVHHGSLFSVFRTDVRTSHLRPLDAYLVAAIETEFQAEGLRSDTFPALDPEGIQIAKTASRGTRGFMDQMAFELRRFAAYGGGLAHCDVAVLNHDLRRMRSHVAQRQRASASYARLRGAQDEALSRIPARKP